MNPEDKFTNGVPSLAPRAEPAGAWQPVRPGWSTCYVEPLEAAAGGARIGGDLFEIINLVLSRKYTVIAIALLTALLAWGICFVQTPLFKARGAVEIQSMAETDAVYQIIDREWRGGGAGSVVSPESYVETQLHILQSRSFQSRVQNKVSGAPRPTSRREYSRARELLGMLGLKLSRPSSGGLPPVSCTSNTVENTRIVEITCQSPDPAFAADYVNTTASEFIAYNLEIQSDTAQRTLKWLTDQLVDMRRKVELAKLQLEKYSAQSGVRFEAEQPDSEKSELKDLQKELSAAGVQRINDQTAYEVALAASRNREFSGEQLAGYQEQILKLKSQRDQLTERYTADHARVRQVQAEIDTLEKIMASHVSTHLQNLKARYEASKLREQRLLEALSKQSEVVADYVRKSMEYETLKLDLERNQKLYQELLQKATEVSLSTAMRNSSQIRVVDDAETPTAPYKPNVRKTVGLGTITGLMLGIGLVLIQERANRRLRSPGEISLHLALPELAVVPRYDHLAKIDGRGHDEGASSSLVHRLVRLGRSQPEPAALVLSDEKPGRVVESFRAAVASILAYRYWKGNSKKVLVTSPCRGDGKTNVISNLGVTLAEIGHKVVLIDGDLRRPQLNEIFGLTNSWGVTTLIGDGIDLKTQPLEALVQKTRIENLSVVTAGPGTSSISRVLHARAMQTLFDRLAAEFDFVLVDTPPAVEFADARVLGRYVDGAVLVIRAGVTTREAAMLVRDRLLEDNLTVIGTILNRWDAKAAYTSSYYGSLYQDGRA